MKLDLIYEPSVHIIGRQVVDNEALARFLRRHGVAGWRTDAPSAAETLVETGGRLCYWSFERPRPGGSAAYITRLIDEQHTSVLEHAVWTFVIDGISRRCCEQVTRHRVGWSPSQRSQRFVDETEGGVLSVIVPPALRHEVETAAAFVVEAGAGSAARALFEARNHFFPGAATLAGLDWLSTVEAAADTYDRLVAHLMAGDTTGPATARRKRAREAARGVLPNATATMIQITANARALRHFVALRASPHADAEIRAVALALLRLLRAEAPDLFRDLAPAPDADGTGHTVGGSEETQP